MNRFVGGILARVALIVPGGYNVRPKLQRWRGVKIGRGVWISQGVYLDELYPEALSIGDNCTIGLRVSILAHFHWGPRRETAGFEPVVIEDNVFVGPHSVILPGVRIGTGSVIRAGSVVTRNVPSHVFWGDPGGRPLARITAPLGQASPYEDFVKGLKPVSSTRDPWGGERAPPKAS